MSATGFLKVVGLFHPTGEYQPGWGYQTQRTPILHAIHPDLTVELVDHEGTVLSDGNVELSEPACGPATHNPAPSRLIGYVPFAPESTALRLRSRHRIIYHAELAPEPPRLSPIHISESENGDVRVSWSASHDRELRFTVAVIDSRRQVIPIARDLSDSEITFRALDIAAGPGCHVALGVTDGLLSATDRSDPIDLPYPLPELTILEPPDGSDLAPDQPISLIGHIVNGPDNGRITWHVDDELATEGSALAVVGSLSPGPHSIQLAYDNEDGLVAVEATVRVRERTPQEQAWHEVSTAHR